MPSLPAPPSLPVLRVVGPPGSGKSLLIVSLTEALRWRGHRVASVERRAGGALVLTLPGGGRVTLEQTPAPPELAAMARSIDPQLDLLLVEGDITDVTDAADTLADTPVLELVPPGGAPATPTVALLATVAPQAVREAFAARGPGDVLGLAAVVERALLGGTPGTASEAPRGHGIGARLRALAARLAGRWRARGR